MNFRGIPKLKYATGMNIFADQSWVGISGTGRYANEVLRRLEERYGDNLTKVYRRNAASPFSPLVLSKSYSSVKGSVFWSPQYMAPLFGYERVVITVHDLLQLKYGAAPKRFYFEYVIKNLIKLRGVIIVTVSEYSKREIIHWLKVPSDRVVVAYNGISEVFRGQINESPLKFPYFLYIGNRRPHKNIFRMLEAFSIAKIPSDVRFVISGEIDDELFVWSKKIGISERLYFLGVVSEQMLPSFYAGALSLVYVSTYEGFGLPVLEGMSTGVPVIASNVTAIPEVAGDAALLVDPYSIDEIANAMEFLLNQSGLRDALIFRGKSRAAMFSWDKTAKTVFSVLEGI